MWSTRNSICCQTMNVTKPQAFQTITLHQLRSCIYIAKSVEESTTIKHADTKQRRLYFELAYDC